MGLRIRQESEIDNDLFNAPEAWKVVTVNCVGAMGKGIALTCKQRWPAIYEDYRTRCRRHEVEIGRLTLYEEEKIILLPTKVHFKDPSTVPYILDGVGALATSNHNFEGGVALPPLGMVNGWLKLRQRQQCYLSIARYLGNDKRDFALYLPHTLYDECRAFLTNR